MNQMEDIEGKELHGYKIIKPIGEGKFSIVYKATRLSNGQWVALKTIKIFDMLDPKQREKCIKEIKLLQSLDHPHIIKFLDSFMSENELLIAIEWAERGDLKRIIRQAQAEESSIEEFRIWDYMYQIADALKHMHEKRIMHRDLKPANIFIAANGALKLGDLGLGRDFSSQTIEAYSRVGTPLYMSPEVLKGEGYDWKSDAWSLGCVVYELWCLRSPFKSDEKINLYELFQNINKGEFSPIPSRYSEELQSMVKGMIVVNPEKRLSLDQIVELCEIHMRQAGKRPRIDPYLIMDDIHEKLFLLDYENSFCMPYRRQPISRIYFASAINPTEQLAYFYELSYWLMTINKHKNVAENSSAPIGPILDMESIGDSNEVAKQIITDVKAFGVNPPDYINLANIKLGYGEGVWHIINDLLNRELIRLDFRFRTPVVSEEGEEKYGAKETGAPESGAALEIEELCEENIIKYEAIPSDDETQLPEDETNTNVEIAQSMIVTSTIDPVDWEHEVRRVSKHLVYNAEEVFGLQTDVHNRLLQLKHYYKVITKNFVSHPKWEKYANVWSMEIDRITAGEKKIQITWANELQVLDDALNRRKHITEQINYVREHVADQCTQFDTLSGKLTDTLDKFENQTNAVSDDKIIGKIKNSIDGLKKEIQTMECMQEIIRVQVDHIKRCS